MKKLLLITLVLMLALVGITNAQSADDLAALAEYAPEDALFFAAIRTDAGFVENLDGLLNSLNERAGGVLPEGVNAQALLDLVVGGLTGGLSFSENVRPWLGDSAALVVPTVDALNTAAGPLVLVAEVTDFETAQTFLGNVTSAEVGVLSAYEGEVQTDGSVVYTSEFSSDPTIILTESVVYYGDVEAALPAMLLPGADARSLNQNDAFTAIRSNLPAESYNAFVYIDAAGIYEDALPLLAPQIEQEMQNQGVPFDMSTLEEIAPLLGQQGLGFTIVQGRAFVMDYAQTGEIVTFPEPLDLSLLERVPATAPLIIQGQGIGEAINSLFDALDMLEQFLVESDVLPISELEDLPFLANLGPTDLGTFIRLSVEGTYGIDLDETLAWMSRDFITYISLPLTEESPLGVWLGSGTLIATDNPEAAAALVEGQAALAQNAFSATTFEDGVLTVPLGALISMPDTFSVSITATDSFYASGTTDAVAYSLEPDGPNITESAGYAFESSLFLNDPTTLFYVDIEPLRAAFEAIVATQGESISEEDASNVRLLLSLLDTASITFANGDGASMARFTLTLSE